MREILFRGKRVDNGRWSKGYYRHHKSKVTSEEISQILVEDCLGFHWVKIIPDTVGQYTGLTDKNGKKIFEGDLLKPFDDEIDKMVVEFHHGSFLLCLYGERGYMGEGGWVEEGNYGVFECEPLSSYGDDVEIIGNIHDNPELLEDGEQNER